MDGVDEALAAHLPPIARDVVEPEMVGARAKFLSLGTCVSYEFFGGHRHRFGWFEDPSPDEMRLQDQIAGWVVGRRWWYILLRHGRQGWRVDKAHPHGSLVSARMSAAAEWASHAGWLIDIVDATVRIGPHQAELADPIRYIEAMRDARKDLRSR